MEYSEKVIEHYTNPRNVGKIENASGIGEVGNPVCGDIMKMFIKVENNIITDVKFKTFGCGAAIATSSISTEMIKGKTSYYTSNRGNNNLCIFTSKKDAFGAMIDNKGRITGLF